MKKFLLILVSVTLLLVTGTINVSAKKVLPTKKSGGVTNGGNNVATSVRFTNYKRAINVGFSGVASARSIDYILSYNSRGTTQGAGGSINPSVSANSASRELLFGTCSHGVCRYDTGITNARLVITIILNNGKKIVRTYRLRV